MKELILGAGNYDKKRLWLDTNEYQNPITLDIDESCKPNVVWDLNKHPLPFKDEEFDEIHAYDILEHLSKQGDYKFFFSEFSEYWRILKPDGRFHASVPRWDRKWAWGDPGHTRVFPVELVTYLDQDEYEEQIGITQMTDYRDIYKVSFKLVYYERCEMQDLFVLKKV